MDKIILEHYKNPCNFLSLNEYNIPFIVDNGLIFNKEQVFKYKLGKLFELEEGILINKKEEGFLIEWYNNGNKKSEGNYKDGKKEGFWIDLFVSGQYLERNYNNGKVDGFWTFLYNNKLAEGNYKDGKEEGVLILKNGNIIPKENDEYIIIKLCFDFLLKF